MDKVFGCLEGCSDCCIYRQYFPSVKYGKIGVLLLPEEKSAMERTAKALKTKISILPRIGISAKKDIEAPEEILAYQLMGNSTNGNYCPFLDLTTQRRAPHGGYICKIYDSRPLACKAYPVISESKNSLSLDLQCTFTCKYGPSCAPYMMENEIVALRRIKGSMNSGHESNVWRYATSVGEKKFRKHFLPAGWYLQR